MIPGLFLKADHGAVTIPAPAFKKRRNKAFAIGSEAEFVDFKLQEISPAPAEAAKLTPNKTSHSHVRRFKLQM